MSEQLVSSEGTIAWVAARLPQFLPRGWRLVRRFEDGAAYLRADDLSVIVSGDVELDGKRWLHVSCARRDRLPSWAELRLVKDLFIGRDEYAVQVIPPERYYVNQHPYCLHLFSCIDGHPLPEFTRFGGTL